LCVAELSEAIRENKALYYVPLVPRLSDASARILLRNKQAGPMWSAVGDSAVLKKIVDEICEILPESTASTAATANFKTLAITPPVQAPAVQAPKPVQAPQPVQAPKLLAADVFERLKGAKSDPVGVELRQLMKDNGDVAGLVALLKCGSAGAQEQAAWALKSLAAGNGFEDKIVDAGALPPLVTLLKNGSAGAQEQAAWALRNLAVGSDARSAKIVDAGALPPLVALLKNGSARAPEQAACALRNLAADNGARKGKIVDAGALPPLVALLKNGSGGAQNIAAWALANLASNDDLRGKIEALKKSV
jgi:HEAT repeat protein